MQLPQDGAVGVAMLWLLKIGHVDAASLRLLVEQDVRIRKHLHRHIGSIIHNHQDSWLEDHWQRRASETECITAFHQVESQPFPPHLTATRNLADSDTGTGFKHFFLSKIITGFKHIFSKIIKFCFLKSKDNIQKQKMAGSNESTDCKQ